MPTVSTLFTRHAPPCAKTRTLARAVALCLGAGSLGIALAEPNPYYLGAGVTLGHDSNIARAADSVKTDFSDSYTEGFLIGGLDQPIGRQRVYADGRVGRTRFNDLSSFDYTGYGARVGIDWEALDRMKGDLRYATQRSRTTDAGANASTSGEKNLETTQELFFRAQYGLVSTLSLEGEFVHRKLDTSNILFVTNEVKQDSVKLGVLYRPGGLLTVGTGIRHTKGDYTGRPDGGFSRNDLEFTAKWDATGQSTLEAQLAIGSENQDNPNASDVSGLTGNLRWTYKPTGKLRFITDLTRERGRDAAFNNTGLTSGNTVIDQNQSRVATSLQVGALWEATAKIGVTADARYVKRDLTQSINNIDTKGKDTTKILGLGLRYEITRNIEASCKVGRESRSASGGISQPYGANFFSCTAQAMLR